MHRLVPLVVTAVLVTSVSVYAAARKSVSVSGNLTGGTRVSASCSVSNTGKASGAGTLSSTNNGITYNYPFTVNGLKTGTNTVF